MKYTNQNEKSGPADGFSLIEVMVAVFILAFGLLAAAQLLTMAMMLEAQSRSKSTAALAAQNEIERLADLYRRNPAAEELAIGAHQSEELTEIRNPITQNVLNMYKITWHVSGIPDPRTGMEMDGRVISVQAAPMLAEREDSPHYLKNKAITLNAVIAAEP